MSSISFSVVGFGRIGQRHAKIIHEHAQCTLCSVCDVEPKHFDRCEELGFPDVKTYHDLDAFLAAEQSSGQRSDVVTIATPNGFHAPYVVDVLTGQTEITATAFEGLKVVQMIERIYDAAR